MKSAILISLVTMVSVTSGQWLSHVPFYMHPAPLIPVQSPYTIAPYAAPRMDIHPGFGGHYAPYSPPPSYSPFMAASAPVAAVVPMAHLAIPPPPHSSPSTPEIQDRSSASSASSSSSSSPGGGFLSKALNLPNDMADKLFPFAIRIATHGEPHLP